MSHDWPMYAGQLEARIQELEARAQAMRAALQEYVSIRNAKHAPDSSYLPDRLVELDRMAAAALATDAGKAMLERVEKAIDCGAVCGTVGKQCQRCLREMFHREVDRAEKAERERDELLEDARFHLGTPGAIGIHDKALEEAAKVAETLPGKHVMGGHRAAMRIATAIRALKTGGGT